MHKGEVTQFAEGIGAIDLRKRLAGKYRNLFRRPNYFILGVDTYLVVKISRKEPRWWGVSKKCVDAYNEFTEADGTYYVVSLDSGTSGWVIPKAELTDLIHGRGRADRPLSISTDDVYKIHTYNLRFPNRFMSVEGFLTKVE